MNSSILSSLSPAVRAVFALLCLACAFSASSLPASAQTRVKDVAVVQGVRDNQLVGYGLVTGLANQGDSDPISTQQLVSNFLKNFGLTINPQNVKAKNSAAVTVTANIRSGARNGSKFDVIVSSLSDAKSLQGGTLMPTPLIGADKIIYAQAQGPLSIGGFTASAQGGGASASLTKNHPTTGMIPDGAIVEREISTDYFANGVLEVSLRESDFTSAVRMANAINEQIGPIAEAVSSGTVRVFVPKEAQPQEKQLEFIARVENIVFKPDVAARIVMNEKTGTIVANSRIQISSVAVAHGNLTVAIVNTPVVSQPNPGTGNTAIIPGGVAQVPVTANGLTQYIDSSTNQTVWVPVGQSPPPGYVVNTQAAQQPGTGATPLVGGNAPTVANGPATAVTGDINITAEEEKKNLVVFNDLPTVNDVAAALNALGVTPRDMMAIFQEMKEAGALQAELVVH